MEKLVEENRQAPAWLLSDTLGLSKLLGPDNGDAFVQHMLFEKELGKSYPKIISAFNSAADDENRVAIVYKAMACVGKFDIDPWVEPIVKKCQLADNYRTSGNEAFKNTLPGSLILAKRFFMKSIIAAKYPVSETDNWSSISLAFGNRSAVQFKLGQYDECLSDIDQAFKLRYPDKLKHKLYSRQGECLHIMGKMEEAKKSFEAAVESLDSASDLTSAKKASLLAVVEGHLDRLVMGRTRSDKYRQPRVLRQLPQLADVASPSVPAASSCVEVAFTSEWGRHFRAARDIQPGEILLVEDPYLVLLSKEYFLTHCYTCLEQCEAMIPCKSCVMVQYCSEACREESPSKSHDLECAGCWHFVTAVEPDLTSLVLRVLFVAAKRHGGLKGLRDYVRQSEENRAAGKIAGFNRDGKYESSDYATVHNLTCPAPEEDFVENTFSRAINSSYFLNYVLPIDSFKKDLADEKVRRFVGGLFQHLQSSLKNNTVGIYRDNHKTETKGIVGWGLYPTLHLMNHACSANAFHYIHGTTAVVMANAPIKKGEQIMVDYTYYACVASPRLCATDGFVWEPPALRCISALQQTFSFTCHCAMCAMPDAATCWGDGKDWTCWRCKAYVQPGDSDRCVVCKQCGYRNVLNRLRKDAEARFMERANLTAKCLTSVNMTRNICHTLTELFGKGGVPIQVIYEYQCMLNINMSQEGKYLIPP